VVGSVNSVIRHSSRSANGKGAVVECSGNVVAANAAIPRLGIKICGEHQATEQNKKNFFHNFLFFVNC
jgi:hypothetical protein